MAKIKMLICCLLFTLPVLAQKEGLRFFKGSWTKALAEAKKNNQLIFVNVYTEWSEAYISMKREIFPLKQVGEKYNAQFINYRVDADWREGVYFNNRYRIEGYPTYLYIDGDGQEVYRNIGYDKDPAWFLSLADTAKYIHEAKQAMPAFDASYESRKNDKAFVMEYLYGMIYFKRSEESIDRVRDHFFSQLSPAELKDTSVALVLLKSITTVLSPVFEHIMANQSFYKGLSPNLSERLGDVILQSIRRARGIKDDLLFTVAYRLSGKLADPLPAYPYLVFLLSNEYYVSSNQPYLLIERSPAFMDSVCRIGKEGFRLRDQQQYEEIMQAYTSGELDSTVAENFAYEKEGFRTAYSRYVASVMNRTADLFLQHAFKQEDLKKACVWAARSVDMDMYNYSYYAVLAKLYAKVGMKREAVRTMQSVITLAKAQGMPETSLKIYRDALKAL